MRLAARLIRLSVGLVLVLVTTLVVVILLVLLIVRLFTSDDGDDFGLALLQGLAQVPLSILDLLVCGIWAPARQGSSSVTPQQLWSLLWDLPGEGAAPASLGFLSAVFSILFGNGDPNARFEPRRWRRIAAVLRQRGGVVIAEDLAPLLDLPDCASDPDRRRDLADAAMLRFDGCPEVSKDGDLIDGFPSLPAGAAPARTGLSLQPGRSRAKGRLRPRRRGPAGALAVAAGDHARLVAPCGLVAGAIRHRLRPCCRCSCPWPACRCSTGATVPSRPAMSATRPGRHRGRPTA